MRQWGVWIALAVGVATVSEASGSPAAPGHYTAGPSAVSSPVWGDGDRAVVLLHDPAGSPRDWGTLGRRLAASGVLVVALDLTGPANDALEVRAALDWLRARGVSSVRLIGARDGANLALHAAGSQSIIEAVALLSPQPTAPGLDLSASIDRYGPRSLLVVASTDDALSLAAARFVARRASGRLDLVRYGGIAQGTRLLNTASGLEPYLVAWVSEGAGQLDGPADLGAEVQTSEVGDIETRGVRLDERAR